MVMDSKIDKRHITKTAIFTLLVKCSGKHENATTKPIIKTNKFPLAAVIKVIKEIKTRDKINGNFHIFLDAESNKFIKTQALQHGKMK